MATRGTSRDETSATTALTEPLLACIAEGEVTAEDDASTANVDDECPLDVVVSTTSPVAAVVPASESVSTIPRRRRRWIFPSPTTGVSNNGSHDQSTEWALAWAPTTHWMAKLCIPLLIGYAHYLFWYGQTRDMWRLTAHWEATMDYTATSRETRYAMDALRIPLFGTITVPANDKVMRTFTYLYAIQELWRAHHMPGVVLPRMAAAGLFVFSGVWPHIKLFMLLLTWWFAKNPIRRRRCLTSLSVLGKWSLVDVLVVCVMVGVLNLQWRSTADSILESIEANLPFFMTLVQSLYSAEQVCSMALHYSCTNPSKVDHIVACKTCRSTVNSWFDNPESVQPILQGLHVTGGGRGQLSVAGMSGIYFFCAAVLLSILLSVVVDWYDHQSRCRRMQQEHQEYDDESSSNATPEPLSSTLSVNDGSARGAEDAVMTNALSTTTGNTTRNDSLLEALLVEGITTSVASSTRHRDIRSSADLDFDRRILVDRHQCAHSIWHGVAWVTLGLVVAATSTVTLERRVHGAWPTLLHEILHVEWTKAYSFWLLGWTTALAGGWDRLLMGTFVWFVIVGPLVRCLLCLWASRTVVTSDLSLSAAARVRRRQRGLSTAIDLVGAFCAWEVFTVAVCMVDLLMPSITSTILLESQCAKVASITGEATCLEVEFVTKRTYALVVVGGCLLVLVSRRIRSMQTYV